MSLKRVVLIVALAALVMPAAALADGVTFAFVNGHMYMVQPANSGGGVIGSVATNDPNVVAGTSNDQLYYVSRFSGSTVPAGPAVPPQIPPTFGTLVPANLLTNFGSVQWTTGPAIASTFGAGFASTTYAPGGSITIFGNGGIAGTGPVLFSGFFSGPTTMKQIPNAKSIINPTCTACQLWYNMTGPVSGVVDPALLGALGLGVTTGSQGLIFNFVVGFVGKNDTSGVEEGGNMSVVVPEPGTLALFGTGLIGVAGFIRRRTKA